MVDRGLLLFFWIVISTCSISVAKAWLFTPAKSLTPAEHRRCDPTDQSWRPYPKDPTRFLFCDTGRRRYAARQCPVVLGSQQIFDSTKKQCTKSNDQVNFKLMTPNEQRVGDPCYVNQDCSDGMYCNNGICACFLNYIEVNMKCIRVSTICSSSHFYAELNTGKPRTCAIDIHCPVNFSCEPHPGSPEINFCCFKPSTSANVCGESQAYIENNKEVTCSVEFPQLHCPVDHWCRYNTQLRRHFCCRITGVENLSTSSTPTVGASVTMSPSTAPSTTPLESTNASSHAVGVSSIGIDKVLGQTIALAELICGPGLAPWVFEGFPMPCNPLPPGVCPPGFICKNFNDSKLHFCCNDVFRQPPLKFPSSSSSSSSSTSGVTSSTTPLPLNATTSPSDNLNVTMATNSSISDAICSNSNPYLLEGQPLICIGSDPLSCPVNYQCKRHPSANISFCCAFQETTTSSYNQTLKNVAHGHINESSICGAAEPLVIYNTTVMCVKNDPQSCPPDYVCQYHEFTNALYCCSVKPNATTLPSSTPSLMSPSAITTTSSASSTTTTASHEGCPALTYPARDPFGRVLTCTTTEPIRKCPIDYNCTYSEAHTRYQCCGLRPVPTLPSSSVSHSSTVSTSTSTPSTIVSNATTSGPPTELCPVGQKAYKDPSTNASKTCIVNTPGNCPAGYFCQFSSQLNRFLCCGVHAGCPANSVAFISPMTGSIQTCAQDEPLCPANYHCARNAASEQVCCSGEAKLCTHGEPLMDSAKIRSCNLNSPCPTDFSCMPSRMGSICCPKTKKRSRKL